MKHKSFVEFIDRDKRWNTWVFCPTKFLKAFFFLIFKNTSHIKYIIKLIFLQKNIISNFEFLIAIRSNQNEVEGITVTSSKIRSRVSE